MTGIADRLKRLFLNRPDSTSRKPSKPETRPVVRGGSVESSLPGANMLAANGDTVPDLQLLDEKQDPGEVGVNPYETSSDFQWRRP